MQDEPEQLADRDAGDVELVPLCPLFLDPRDLGGCLSKWRQPRRPQGWVLCRPVLLGLVVSEGAAP
jgi:hypothetical protein